jgi:hypothetical protein
MIDKVGQEICIGDKFIRDTTLEIYQVVGFSEDGRVRAQEARLYFAGNPYAPPKRYGSTEFLLGPIYLFRPYEIQINKEWSQ